MCCACSCICFPSLADQGNRMLCKPGSSQIVRVKIKLWRTELSIWACKCVLTFFQPWVYSLAVTCTCKNSHSTDLELVNAEVPIALIISPFCVRSLILVLIGLYFSFSRQRKRSVRQVSMIEAQQLVFQPILTVATGIVDLIPRRLAAAGRQMISQ